MEQSGHNANLLLQHLPSDLWNEVHNKTQEIEITREARPCDPRSHIAFPLSGMLSLVVNFEDGTAQEVGCIGREGMSGAHTIWSNFRSELSVVGQAKGRAIILPIPLVASLTERSVPFRNAISEYISKRLVEVSQTAACNGQHSVPQRLAKWILIAADRIESNQVLLTHDYLALMLGTRRATVTVAAQRFAGNGWISYRRGSIQILDSHALQRAACVCYALSPFPMFDSLARSASPLSA
jgi:CRP-like cAMP-binding protein